MNVIDSSAWLEYLADSPNAKFFEKPILDTKNLIVPSIILLEVFKKVLSVKGEDLALQTAALMQQGIIVDLNAETAILAARLGYENKLPTADSIILATARTWNAVLWTQDADFQGIEGVKYFTKKLNKQ